MSFTSFPICLNLISITEFLNYRQIHKEVSLRTILYKDLKKKPKFAQHPLNVLFLKQKQDYRIYLRILPCMYKYFHYAHIIMTIAST